MVSNSLNEFNIFNQTNYDIDDEIKVMKKYVNDTLEMEKVSNAEFNIIFVDNSFIKELNKKYRNIDRETDVISFALEDEKKEDSFLDNRMLGDIYISVDKAKSQAIEYGHSLKREISFLAVHGLLHLLGYDHMNKDDEEVMFGKQELILDGQA